MSTEDKNLTLRFLDIEHVLTKQNNKSFFITTDKFNFFKLYIFSPFEYLQSYYIRKRKTN